LLLEIGTEELPAADVDSAVAHLTRSVPEWLTSLRLVHREVRVAGTPRRLVLRVASVEATQPDAAQAIKGPPAHVAFDSRGNPTRAAQGFARSRGIPVTDLRPEQVDGGTYAVAHVTVRGCPAAEVLGEALPQLIAGIPFPRSMRWNASNVAFSRPIRWLVALLGELVLPIEHAGVVAGRASRGLRPSGSPPIEVSASTAYDQAIAAAGIVLDHQARAAAIREQCRVLAQEIGGTVPDDPALLAEVANLVEAPVPLRGGLDPRYLALPREVLVTVMRKHQRYFPVEQDGRLLPAFIAVANGPIVPDTVRRGNEQVLAARFADATFFWEQDRRTPLQAKLPRLERLTFQEALGSMRAKAQRIEQLTPAIGRAIGLSPDEAAAAVRIAHLAKADLATQMVAELTSLQGVVGREYARLDGEPEAVAAGIFEHYLPRHAGDRLPASLAAIAVGIADRLDTLVGLFAAGLAPRATADPFALRRTAFGLVQIVAEHGLNLNLRAAVAEAAAIQPIAAGAAPDEVLTFIRRRLERWLLDQGCRHDVVQATLAARGDTPGRAVSDARELTALVDTEPFRLVLTAYRRAARLARGRARGVPTEVTSALFAHDAERVLWSTLQLVQATISPDLTVGELVQRIEPLVAPIDTFLRDVLVMAKDERVQLNRLEMLRQIADLPTGIVDLAEVRSFWPSDGVGESGRHRYHVTGHGPRRDHRPRAAGLDQVQPAGGAPLRATAGGL
jgi:glycyl-tRNA synthetase